MQLNLNYNLSIKTLNKNISSFKYFFLKFQKKNKIKKYIITKASFKYKKTKEQYALFITQNKIKWKEIKISPKIFEIFLEIFFIYSNKYIIKIKKTEKFLKKNNNKFRIL